MDYADGTHIAKWQWDLIHDPGVVMRVFERDKDAEIIKYKNKIILNWKAVNPPQHLEAKQELKYIAEAGYEEPGKERTSFFKLEDNSTIVARYQDPDHIAEQQFKYEIRFAGDNTWYGFDIHTLTDVCLHCDLAQIWSSISMTAARMNPVVFLGENVYILISGTDFQIEESSRVEAGVWIVVGVAGGKILKYAGYLTQKAFTGSKTVINSATDKLFKLIKGDKGVKIVELSADEVARIFPSLIRQLTVKPSYKPLRTIWSKEGKTTTFIGKWSEIIDGKQNGLQKVFEELSENDLNIYMLSGKFEHPGGFNMLSVEGWTTKVVNEAVERGILPNTKAFEDFIWNTYNRPWLENALQRGDDIIIWSDPINSRNGFYKMELDFIQSKAFQYGYDYNNGIIMGIFSK
jgi:hypothetical protein